MADYGFDGMIKVSFVPAIASLAAPTVTELNAGTSLEGRLTADGLNTGAETAEVDTSKLNSVSNSAVPGRRTFAVSVKYVRGDGVNDKAVEAALVYGAKGFLVIRRDKLSTVAWTAADKVEVYPVAVRQPNPDAPAANALQAVDVPMVVTSEPKGYADYATVGAGA
jgi:hypothetical protein